MSSINAIVMPYFTILLTTLITLHTIVHITNDAKIADITLYGGVKCGSTRITIAHIVGSYAQFVVLGFTQLILRMITDAIFHVIARGVKEDWKMERLAFVMRL